MIIIIIIIIIIVIIIIVITITIVIVSLTEKSQRPSSKVFFLHFANILRRPIL